MRQLHLHMIYVTFSRLLGASTDAMLLTVPTHYHVSHYLCEMGRCRCLSSSANICATAFCNSYKLHFHFLSYFCITNCIDVVVPNMTMFSNIACRRHQCSLDAQLHGSRNYATVYPMKNCKP